MRKGVVLTAVILLVIVLVLAQYGVLGGGREGFGMFGMFGPMGIYGSGVPRTVGYIIVGIVIVLVIIAVVFGGETINEILRAI